VLRGKAIFDNPKPVLSYVEVSQIEKSKNRSGFLLTFWRGRVKY